MGRPRVVSIATIELVNRETANRPSTLLGATLSLVEGSRIAFHAPWHFLYFLPLPHGHGSLRPTFGSSRFTCLTTSSPPVRAGRGADWPPALPRIAPNGDGGGAVCGELSVICCGGRRGWVGRIGAAAPAASSPVIGVSRHRYRTISSSTRSFIAWKSAK